MGLERFPRFHGVRHAISRRRQWLTFLATGVLLGYGLAQIDFARPGSDTVAGIVPHSPIMIDQRFGDVPFTVSITGPPALLDRVSEWVEKRRDCATGGVGRASGMQGFSIGWGDDKNGTMAAPASAPVGPDGCPDLLKHTYTTRGAYTINARLFHIGPTDGFITDWAGDAWVSVNGPEQPLELQLVAPTGGETYTLRQPLIVRWQIAGDAADLLIELLGPDDKPLIVHRLEDVAYDGTGQLDLFFVVVLGANNPLFMNGSMQARVRMQALNHYDRVVWRQESDLFTLSVK